MPEIPKMLGPPRILYPGRAGELQSAGDAKALAGELANNYADYHADLAQRLARTGGRPDPSDFDGDYVAYLEAGQACIDILCAEQYLRECRMAIPQQASPDPAPPLVDPARRLVSVETAQPEPGIPPAEAGWKPLPWPPR